MDISRTCYRKLKKYKYQLMEDVSITIKKNIAKHPVQNRFIELDMAGHLVIKTGYAWDGPSGPTCDTKTFMRGALVHDALYQLMREGHIDDTEHRQYADELLRDICKLDGMCSFRAAYVYFFVRKFSGKYARKTEEPMAKTICIPEKADT